jgi:hypothetical protein
MLSTEETDYAQGWRPEKGDKVAGVVVDIAATDGGYGIYPIVTLRTDSGEVAVHAFHTVLRRELARRRPSVGDEIEITYLGKQAGRSGDRGYDGYRVRSDKDVVGYDWSQELVDAQPGAVDDPVAPPIAPAPVPAASTPVPVPTSADPVDDDDVPFLWRPASWESVKHTNHNPFGR